MPDLYFDSLRLKMGMGGRFVVRLVTYVSYGALTAAGLTLIFAELRWMQSLGIFIALFLIDRLLHFNQAEKKLTLVSEGDKVNLSYYTSSSAFGILEKSVDKASFLGGDVFLWVTKQCLIHQSIRKMLLRLDVRWKDFEKKIDELLKEDLKNRSSKKQVLDSVKVLVVAAGRQAIVNQREYIKPEDLFISLGQIESLILSQLLSSFELKQSDLENIFRSRK